MHEERFPPPRLSARCRFSQGTFAGMRGNGRDAPSAVIPALAPERGGSTQSGSLGDELDGSGAQRRPPALDFCASRLLEYLAPMGLKEKPGVAGIAEFVSPSQSTTHHSGAPIHTSSRCRELMP